MKYVYVLSLCLLHFQFVSARHIIGGSMSYSYTGNDNYLIQLEVLRDCAGAGADFDNPASIGIFDKDGNLVRQLFVTHGAVENISSNPNNICLFPPTICVERTYYQVSANLPFIDGGYTISYQRCCRAIQIVNLENPSAIGMTFHTHIDPAQHNSSALFGEELPYAMYVNTPFVFNTYAMDPDGDSLSYALTSPFVGGDTVNIQPQPPVPPPYLQAVFKSPYSVGNMLGGDYPLTINPITGEMTAIPSITGVFQIAYTIQEYRNGILIGTSYREFAFYVSYGPPNLFFDVSGSVLINDSMPLDAGRVQLFKRNLIADSTYLYGEQDIDSKGTYSFKSIPAGIFYVKAIIGPASIYFDSYLPTYYSSASVWYDATTLSLCDTSRYYRDIHLIHIDSFDGNFILDGMVHFAGHGGDPVPGLNVLLANENSIPIQARTTDDAGYFKFEHLPSGTYKLFADLVNSPIDNLHAPQIYLSKDTTVLVYLHRDSLSLQIPTGIESGLTNRDFVLNVYPNPVLEKFTLEVKTPEDNKVFFGILDVNGRTIRSGKIQSNHSEQINSSGLAAGIYIVKIEVGGVYGYSKMIKI